MALARFILSLLLLPFLVYLILILIALVLRSSGLLPPAPQWSNSPAHQTRRETRSQAFAPRRRRLALPHHQHPPTGLRERSPRPPIAGRVALQLRDPVPAPRRRDPAPAAAMHVPETAADE